MFCFFFGAKLIEWPEEQAGPPPTIVNINRKLYKHPSLNICSLVFPKAKFEEKELFRSAPYCNTSNNVLLSYKNVLGKIMLKIPGTLKIGLPSRINWQQSYLCSKTFSERLSPWPHMHVFSGIKCTYLVLAIW